MKSPYNFVVKPIGERYSNSKDVDGKKLILNTEIYNHEYVNRKAEVLSCPSMESSSIKPGAEVIVHHNVFRRWYDVKGVERNSKAWFSEDKYIISSDQIFLYDNGDGWNATEGFSFVEPLRLKKEFVTDELEDPTRGIVTYSDGTHEIGVVVGFTPFSKYEFIINGKRLYRVYNKFITIKYEREGNEEAYNPSWARSG